jgi:amidase
LTATLAGGALAAAAPLLSSVGSAEAAASGAAFPSFELEEATIEQLQQGLASKKWSARDLAEKYLARIAMLDRHGPAVNSVIELNPDALSLADELDRERKEKGSRGPLHGIPILIKDNIDTHDRMATTAGSLALLGSKPLRDAHIVERLRAAGALILGKTNLSEWANFRSTHASSGWSGRGRQTHNPYVLDRNASGSSSGSAVAVAANFCAAAVGSETDGSVVSPSSTCGIVGIKPTIGLVSRAGIIPIAHSQDTAGPMARTVTDAAILLTALAGSDPRDKATADADAKKLDYTKYLDANGLKGARIGVVRSPGFGLSDKSEAVLKEAEAAMKNAGATVMSVEMPTIGQYDNEELLVLLYEFKADLNDYLAALGPDAPMKSLKDLIDFNERHREEEMPYFGQELFTMAQEKGPLTTKEYIDARAKCVELSRAKGIDAAIEKNKLDALVAITSGPGWPIDLVSGDRYTGGSSTPAAVAGYPDVTVPAGFVHGLPVGISFFGKAWSEPVLIKLAYSYEQGTKARRVPGFLPTLELL